MSFLKPKLLIIGPDKPNENASDKFKLPIFINRDFQILFVDNIVKISVRDLKQFLAKIETSKKN